MDINTDLQFKLMQYQSYVDSLPLVLQYRQAYYESKGKIADGVALPTTHIWPPVDKEMSYKDKLVSLLKLSTSRGIELGPLHIPIIVKDNNVNILYVDHLDTDGLRKKYSNVHDIVEVDRVLSNNSIKETFCNDHPFDYIIASQVGEHVPDLIRWFQDIESVLQIGGILSIALPDRRTTFDFFREETRMSDIIAAYFGNDIIPSVRAVYDHHSLANFINMDSPDSLSPDKIIAGYGSTKPKLATDYYMDFVNKANSGEYLDVHCWVFTPLSFLLIMYQLVNNGFTTLRLKQFYPTDFKSNDRSNQSFIMLLEKVESSVSKDEIKNSYLEPLGDK